MKKIGLIGEAPNDTYAIANLLNQKLKGEVIFIEMIKNIRGSNLDNQKTKNRLRKNYERIKPDWVIMIRDLDGLEDDKEKLKHRKKYFSIFNKVIDKKGVFLLHVFEIEAIILSDINTFNKFYNSELTYIGDPMKKKEPKEFLMEKSKYKESDCPELFKKLDIETIINNCRYFKSFFTDFTYMIYK